MFTKKIKSLFIKEQMFPTLISLFINPFYFSRKNLLKNLVYFSSKLEGKLLDVGCGNKPYEKLFRVNKYVGLEFDSIDNRNRKNADFFYTEKFPFEDKVFDSVISTQVLEHVANQNLFLSEINRILKVEGICLITVPFIYPEHEKPFDFFRYTSFGLKEKLRDYGFKIIEYKKSTTGIAVLFQLLNDYLYKRINSNIGVLNIILIVILISPSNIIGSILSKILPDDEDFFLDNIILVEKFRDI